MSWYFPKCESSAIVAWSAKQLSQFARVYTETKENSECEMVLPPEPSALVGAKPMAPSWITILLVLKRKLSWAGYAVRQTALSPPGSRAQLPDPVGEALATRPEGMTAD